MCDKKKNKKMGHRLYHKNDDDSTSEGSLYSVIERHVLELPVFDSTHNFTGRVFFSFAM